MDERKPEFEITHKKPVALQCVIIRTAQRHFKGSEIYILDMLHANIAVKIVVQPVRHAAQEKLLFVDAFTESTGQSNRERIITGNAHIATPIAAKGGKIDSVFTKSWTVGYAKGHAAAVAGPVYPHTLVSLV